LDLIVLRARPDLPALWHGLTGGPQRPTARQQGGRSFATLTVGEREDLVRSTVAAVLGYRPDQVGATQAFRDLGFDSLTAVELRNRIQAITGTTLPASVVFEQPDVRSLAAHLGDQLATPSGVRRTDIPRPAIEDLYLSALESGQAVLGDELALSAAKLRPRYSSSEAPTLSVVPLSPGDSGVPIVCVCPPLALNGPQTYMRFAAELGPQWNVGALVAPGFGLGSSLPESTDVLIGTMADAVTAHVGDGAFVLSGLSSGGVLAHEVAYELQRRGVGPEAVVLLDSYRMNDPVLQRWKNGMAREGLERARLLDYAQTDVEFRFEEITASAWICGHLLYDWAPSLLAVPSLLVRAAEPVVAEDGDRWRTTLAASTTVEVPGDHFGIMEGSYVSVTAEVVGAWLAGKVVTP
ncbi:thioesterase domain-containing protein, partial [Nocardia sp. NPDC088792]|uniref:thioesterase domain-containing protein n=1 Tax=Nocardia sp. NPDC088792 TaxID=3364332 RepID=UPI00381967D7